MAALQIQSILIGICAVLLGMIRLSHGEGTVFFGAVYAVLLIAFGTIVGFYFAALTRQKPSRGAAFASPAKVRALRRKIGEE